MLEVKHAIILLGLNCSSPLERETDRERTKERQERKNWIQARVMTNFNQRGKIIKPHIRLSHSDTNYYALFVLRPPLTDSFITCCLKCMHNYLEFCCNLCMYLRGLRKWMSIIGLHSKLVWLFVIVYLCQSFWNK